MLRIIGVLETVQALYAKNNRGKILIFIIKTVELFSNLKSKSVDREGLSKYLHSLIKIAKVGNF